MDFDLKTSEGLEQWRDWLADGLLSGEMTMQPVDGCWRNVSLAGIGSSSVVAQRTRWQVVRGGKVVATINEVVATPDEQRNSQDR
jgi:hypothetical protein